MFSQSFLRVLFIYFLKLLKTRHRFIFRVRIRVRL